jgi:hypothetical protein
MFMYLPVMLLQDVTGIIVSAYVNAKLASVPEM